MATSKKEQRAIDKPRCSEEQVNSIRSHDFDCKLESGGHNVHIDRKTGQRWGHRGFPTVKKSKVK